MILRIGTSHLVKPEGNPDEARSLGVFVQSVRVVPALDARSKDPVLASLPGSPGLMAIPFIGGFARGLIEQHTRAAFLIRAFSPGRVFIGDGERKVSIKASVDGQFHVPSRLAADASWFIYQSSDPESEGEVRIEGAGDIAASTWFTLSVDATATLSDYRQIEHENYRHVAATLAGSTLIHDAQPLYILIQQIEGEGFWEIRPSYGPAWNALYDFGIESSDDAGLLRRGSLRDLMSAVVASGDRQGDATDGDFVAAAIMRSVLVGAINALADQPSEVPRSFLLWIVQELLGDGAAGA